MSIAASFKALTSMWASVSTGPDSIAPSSIARWIPSSTNPNRGGRRVHELSPAEHRRAIGEQDLAHVVLAHLKECAASGKQARPRVRPCLCCGRHWSGDVCRDLFADGTGQSVFAWEVVVQRAPGDLRLCADVLHRHTGMSAAAEHLAIGDQPGLGLLAVSRRSAVHRPPAWCGCHIEGDGIGLALPTYCM